MMLSIIGKVIKRVVELVNEILSKIGIYGVIISTILVLAKINPIPSISSSWVELKLSTKENRVYSDNMDFY